MKPDERDGLCLVMDNAGIHNTDAVQHVLETYQVRRIAIPPYSPDMNAIEHMWAWLKDKIYSTHSKEAIESISSLDHLAGDTWLSLEPERVMADFKLTLQAIINSGGEYTGG